MWAYSIQGLPPESAPPGQGKCQHASGPRACDDITFASKTGCRRSSSRWSSSAASSRPAPAVVFEIASHGLGCLDPESGEGMRSAGGKRPTPPSPTAPCSAGTLVRHSKSTTVRAMFLQAEAESQSPGFALLVALVGGTLGGLVTQVGAYLRLRYDRRARWAEPLHVAAADVAAFYVKIRNQVTLHLRTGAPLAPYDELFHDSLGAHARLMTTPGGDRLAEPANEVYRVVRNYWEWARGVGEVIDQDELKSHRNAALDAVSSFESATRRVLK